MNEEVKISRLNDRFWNYAAFIAAMSSGVSFRMIGLWSLADIVLLIAVLGFLNVKKSMLLQRVLLLGMLWIFGAVLSNFYNGTILTDALKGIVSKFLFLCDIVGIYIIFHGNPFRIVWFLYGKILGSLIAIFVPSMNAHAMDMVSSGYDLYSDYYGVWLIYLCVPIVTGVVSLMYFYGRRKIAKWLMEGFAVVTLFYNSRNIFLTWTIAFAWLGSIERSRNNVVKRFSKIIIIVGTLISIFAAKELYSKLAENYVLGERAHDKYVMQSDNEEIGLMSGRIDFFIALMAISEHPIIGYGDYARDKYDIKVRFFEKRGLMLNTSKDPRLMFIPGHSYIFGSWVYSGLFGVIFWLYVGYLVFVFLKKYVDVIHELLCVNLLFCLPFIWDYLFSPFGGRIEPALIIAYIVVFIDFGDSMEKHKGSIDKYRTDICEV